MKLVGEISIDQTSTEKSALGFIKLAPDGKIYMAGTSNHKYISVINRPNCPGKLSDFRPYALALKEYNNVGLSNTPFFEIPPASYSCDSLTQTTEIIEPIAIYPNPATSQINISSTDVFQTYQITGITGKIALKGVITSKNDINVATLPDGLYFLSLYNASTQVRAVGKFVVKH
jgi:hypothetical protein